MATGNSNQDQSQVQEPVAETLNLNYRLTGTQVEPTASLWLDGTTTISTPTLIKIKEFSEATQNANPRLALNFAQDFPFTPGNPDVSRLDAQLETLVALAAERANKPYPKMVTTSGGGTYPLTPISRFINLQPIPFGTVLDTTEHTQHPVATVTDQHLRIRFGTKIVDEGQELARVFESETPGLFHRHALNWLFFSRADISPPRQARIWMALDMTIYAALNAAWHYKWQREPYSRLLRPIEYDRQKDKKLNVLFDHFVSNDGHSSGDLRPCPEDTPGTPRHPSWPSGHSTFSAAASHILDYVFSPDTLGTSDNDLYKAFPAGPPNEMDIRNPGWIAAELRRLADNIGQARLWAGVHWESDHIAGQKIGRSAAQAVIKQLEDDCIKEFTLPETPKGKKCPVPFQPPTNNEIIADAHRAPNCTPMHDKIEQPEEERPKFLF